MELKDYQQTALTRVKSYLELLATEKDSGNVRHASEDAWEQLFGARSYQEKRNGLGRDLPAFCLKIPTGGGKTLLAVKTIDLINTYYVKKQTGLVLWIVPTKQIYQQTLQNLRNREHAYRQQLDIASAGKTIIMERTDRLAPEDVAENLVVMILMLPAANRVTKDQLRMFRDNGAFQDFFPDDDHLQDHVNLLEKVPNLDTFSDQGSLFDKQVKTSLGNVLMLLQPVVILDESHKAYSEGAKQTLYGFNPSIICELSATPPAESNVLVDISGRQLWDEDMIKLDLHLINKDELDWKPTLLESVEKLNQLDAKAKDYEAETNIYIRPIMVIQVERTGKDQRDGLHIHSEDVREHLINIVGIPADQVAVKTSETDELKHLANDELLSKDCPIRFIITKQALQEGWDCPFAYVLTILNNPRSQTALTQLVGRILRQPFARKTGVTELDESYVYAYQRTTGELVQSITQGFEKEGLGDLKNKVVASDGKDTPEATAQKVSVRPAFQKAASEILLPMFVVDHPKWRPVNYEIDIAANITWDDVDLSPLYDLALVKQQDTGKDVSIGFSEDGERLFGSHGFELIQKGGFEPKPEFMARHLLETVPNPWQAYEISQDILDKLLAKSSKEKVIDNFVYIIQKTLDHLENERDRLAQKVFNDMIASDTMRFIVAKKAAYKFPKTREIETSNPLMKSDRSNFVQKSLFEREPADEFDGTEKSVAWFLDDQQKLFFWLRNIDRKKESYYLQGWRKNKVYPDFLFTVDDDGDSKIDKVYVAEVKGEQLKGSDDTEYKEHLLELCNNLAEQKEFNELALEMKGRKVKFQMLYQSEWRQKLSEILS
ncbi:MAG: DEAD/DEAH box helicase [Candidatus Saccharimonadales bacterium]